MWLEMNSLCSTYVQSLGYSIAKLINIVVMGRQPSNMTVYRILEGLWSFNAKGLIKGRHYS